MNSAWPRLSEIHLHPRQRSATSLLKLTPNKRHSMYSTWMNGQDEIVVHVYCFANPVFVIVEVSETVDTLLFPPFPNLPGSKRNRNSPEYSSGCVIRVRAVTNFAGYRAETSQHVAYSLKSSQEYGQPQSSQHSSSWRSHSGISDMGIHTAARA